MATLLLLSTLFLVGSEDPSANAWPGFLGAGASSVTAESVPLEWAPDQNMAWKHELVGEGQSSPIVWNGQVYVTTVKGPMKDTNHVLAFDAQSGKALWDYTFPTSLPVKNTLYVSRAAPTPAADANGIYVFFESGDLVALDHAGKFRWQRSLTKDFGKYRPLPPTSSSAAAAAT